MQPSVIPWVLWVAVHSCQLSSALTTSLCPRSCTCVPFTLGHNITCCRNGSISVDVLNLGPNAYSLDFSDCRITIIPEGAFANATNLVTLIIRHGTFKVLKKTSFSGLKHLQQLVLTRGQLKTVEPGAFGILTSLKRLSIMSNGDLPLSALPAILDNISPHNTLEELQIGKINGVGSSTGYSLEKDYLRGLRGLNIRLFTFVCSNIGHVNAINLAYIGNIQCVSFRQNSINILRRELIDNVPSIMSSNTVVMDFMYQVPIAEDIKITSIAETCEEAISDSRVLSCPRMSSSDTRTFIMNNPDFSGVSLPPKLQRINFGYTGIKSTVRKTVVYDNNVTHINLEGNFEVHFKGPIIGLTCLRFITFAGTKLRFTKVTSFLRYFPSLEYLNMSTTYIGAQLESENLVFDNATNIRILDLSDNELYITDAIDYSSLYPSLKFLYLHNNNFRSIPSIPSPQLMLLDMQQNMLTTISKDDRNHLETLFQENPSVKLRLAGNPFDCQCSRETYAFIEWFQKNQDRISDMHEVVCTIESPHGTVMEHISVISVLKFRSTCNRDIIIGIVGPFSGVLVMTIAAVIIYKKQWLLKLKWYRLRNRVRYWNCRKRAEEGGEEIVLDEDTERNDKVYIIFCIDKNTEDYSFANNDIAQIVSHVGIEPIYHLTTCTYFLGNRPQTIDISKAMDECNHCIIVFSPRLIHTYSDSTENYDDEQDRRSVILAIRAIHMAQEMFNVITIFYKQPTPTEWMDDTFQEYLKLLRNPNRFLEWYDDDASQQLTKEKLLKILTGNESGTKESSCCCQ